MAPHARPAAPIAALRQALRARALPLAALLCASLAGCGGPEGDDVEDDQHFTSDVATLMQFEFDGELLTAQNANLRTQVKAQLFYTVGQLNASSSNSRLDKLVLTTLTSAYAGSGLYRVRYHAKLPVAWASKTNLPTRATLKLPRRADAAGLQAFFNKYQATCTDPEGHEVTAGNIWFYFRPAQSGCALADADAVTAAATVTTDVTNTTGKYPEYHRVWEDRSLRVLAVFGKYDKSGTAESDAGIDAFDSFVAAAQAKLTGAVQTPAFTGPAGIAHPDVTLRKDLGGGRDVVVTALLVDEVKTAPASFDKRYGELTAGADLIVYNGHAGLGSNIASLQLKGNFFPGKYQIVFFDGCDTFAYLDNTLANRRAALNPDDPAGTRYLDIVTNAMPAYFNNMPAATMALINALLDDAHPRTYPAIFRDVSADHVVVATGEEDNVYTPGLHTPAWPNATPITELGFVAKRETVLYTSPVLPAGKYVFTLLPDAAFPGGDADLRVRAGAAPDLTQTWKCPSYVANSNERCVLKLAAPAKVFMSVTGDALGVQSHFELRAFAQ